MFRSFETAYDKRLVGLFVAALVVPWVLLFSDARSHEVPATVWWAVGGVSLFVITLIRVTAWPVEYAIEDDVLRIRSGFVSYRIVLGSIVRVEPTRSILSAPAWSLDRLRIVFRAGKGLETALMISPADKKEFVHALEEACGRPLTDTA